ncbi:MULTISPECIES: lambda exonuclease family protein [Cysteiniphilum]|uniref:lambda exonuclease family protein n=1 Tax=Cysteiniphilum TaxID=2056696 RepID=UPI00178194D5|nr:MULTISPECIES: lambda exonuclease family protein [Cysteiniphilum]
MLELNYSDLEEYLPPDLVKKPKYKIHNFEQNSEEWFACRLGKLTASNMQIIMGDGDTREAIIQSKAAEVLTGVLDDSQHFKSKDMVRGNELEDDARMRYSEVYSVEVETFGFIELDEFVGVSPDGLSKNGGLEIKCPNNKNYLNQIVNGEREILELYKTQCQMSIWVAEREWWDYVIYNPNFSHDIHRWRIYRDDLYIERIKQAVERAKADIAKYIVKFNKAIGA